jgi:hypothetical protein
VLCSWLGGPIDETRDIVLRGWGYSTAEEAEQAALRWRSAMTIGFAAHHLGADFGQRAAAKSYMSPAFRAAHATNENPVVLHDVQEGDAPLLELPIRHKRMATVRNGALSEHRPPDQAVRRLHMSRLDRATST